jgi:hypothetical protein
MNEQAIQDAYNLFVSQGYRKSIEEFRSLISENEQALQDVYGLFVDQGYRKSKDDFSILMGLREQTNPQVEEPVKKKDGSELLSEDGSLESAESFNWENFEPFSFENTPIQPKDTRSDGYRNPMQSIGMYPDQAAVDRALRQQAADIKFTQQLQEQEAPALQALQQEEANRQEEIRQRYETERQATINSPEFETALSATDTKAMEMDEEDAIGYFNNLYGKYGFIFRETGIGDALEVTAPDGTTHDVDLQTFFSNESEASKLRNFVTSKARKPYETISAEEQNELDLSLRAQEMRKVARINPDGTESTVLFQSAEIDGKHVVYPTLFPKSASQNYGSHPLFWMELDGNAAYEEALKRGEVFEFDSEEDAQDFAEGSWKNYDNIDGEARTFYNERGLDYVTYKQKKDRLDEVRETIEFLEEGSYYQGDLSEEDKQKYNAYYINGVRRSDAENIITELNEEADVLRETVNAPEFLTIREDFDLELQKKFAQRSEEAAQVNRQAVQAEDAVQYQSLRAFGVRAEDLRKIVPKNEQEKQQIDYLSAIYEDAKALSQEAANKYEVANTYLDSKFDKQLQGEFVENWGAAANAWESGWANGKAGNAILAISLGLEDVDDETSVEELAEKIVQYMEEAQTGRTSRVESRWHNAKGFEEAWRVFANDPVELSGAFVAQSLSQMLPYGWKIISGSTATGAGTGAIVGSVVPGAGTAAGALTGASWGLRTGFAATSVALEYTNAVLDAARNQGFDLNDPEQVKQALQTESVWDEGRDIGLKRGLTIGVVDMLSAGLAGRVFKTGQLATRGTRIAAGVGERVVFDPLMEGVGEAGAMYVAGQELDGKEIAAEMIGGLGNNTPTAAFNMYLDGRATNNIKIANDFADLNNIASSSYSDGRITSWANNMERLGQISSEQNQRIQENVGLRREARDLLNVGQGKRNFGVTNSSQLEGRLMQLLAARDELSSTPNRQSVFAGKLAEINEEISEIATTKKLRPAEQQTLLAGQGVISAQEQESGTDIRQGLSKYAINGKSMTKEQFLAEIEKMSSRRLLKSNITVDNDEETSNKITEKFDAIQEPSTESVDAQEQTGDSGPVGTGVSIEGEVTETTTPEIQEQTQPDVETEITTEEVSSKTLNEQEVDDLNSLFDNDADPQFQLDAQETSPEKKQQLVSSATKLMEQVQPEVESESVTVETPAKVYPVTVTENTELANKVSKMGLNDLVGKRVNFVMADQLKVDDKRMGGPFFPLQEGLYGEVAWASISQSAAESIAKGAVNADYSVVYNMSPSAVDSNLVLLDTLIDKVKESPNRPQLFEAMMADIQSKVYGPKTDFVHKIAAESQNIDDFAEGFAQLDVDTKAKIFRDVLPSQNVEASTEVGRLFQSEGISQESVRQENVEQFVSDLPMGAMTMVLQITDKNGNPVTNETYKDAVITPEEQKERGLKEHRNYPFYLRGKAVGMMEETAPFWTVSKRHRNTIDAKVAGVVTDSKGKKYSAGQARSAEMRRASMQASRTDVVETPTATMYEKFINRLSKAFPGVEVMTDQQAFDDLVSDLNAKKLATKNQKIYGAVYQGKLYLNPALENYNTPIHEFGHIWMNVSKEMNPEAYKRGLELVEGTEYVSQIENNKEYQRVIKQMKKDGMSEQDIRNYILEEALATAIGDKGESFATAAQQRNFKTWLNDLFDFVKKLVGISEMTSEELQNIDFDKFLEGVVVDLMSENKLFKDAEVKGLSNELQLMTSAPNPSIDSLVQRAREAGFSDDAIRVVLKEKGFKATAINNAMEVRIDLLTPMPREFGNVEGGSNVGVELFNRVRDKVNRFSTEGPRGGRGTTRTKSFSEIRAKAQEILQADPTYQSQPEQTQLELRNALDRSLGIRSNPQVRQEIGNIRKRLRERKGAIKNITDAQRQLRMFIRKALPKSKNYSNAAINKLLKAINETTPKNFNGQVEVVLNQVEAQRQVIKNQLIDKIQKLVEKKAKTAQTSSKRRRSAGLDAIGQAYFAEVKKVLKMVKNNDVAGLAALQAEVDEAALTEAIAKVEAGEKITRQERALIDKQLALDTFSDVMGMELEEVSQLFDDVKQTRAESIARLNNRKAARREAVKNVQSQFDEQIEDDYSELYDENGKLKNKRQIQRDNDSIIESFKDKGFVQGVKDLFSNLKRNNKYNANQIQKFLRNTIQHLGTITNILDRGKDGMFTKVFYNQLNDMDERNLQGVFEQEDKLNDVTESVLGKAWRKWKYTLGTDTLTLEGVKNGKTEAEFTEALNRDQAMRVYALSLNPLQRKKLERQGFDDAKMERIKNFIGPEGVAIAEQIVDYFSNEYYNQVNDVFVQANDVNLGYVENYFPTKTISKNAQVQDMISGDFAKIFTADTSPALQERTDTTGDIFIGDSFTDVVENHIQSMERYKAYALGVKQMNEVYKSEAIQTLLETTGLGPVFRQMINYAINPDSGPKPEGGVVSWLQRNFTGFALAFKPIQVLKQATSFVQAYEDYQLFSNRKTPVVDALGFIADYAYVLATIPKQVREAKEISATFKNRIRSGMSGDLFGLESGGRTYKKLGASQGRRGKLKRAFDTGAALFTVAGDIAGVLGYKAVYNRAIKNGMSKAEALALFNNYNQTQQTRRSTEKVALQQDQGFAGKFFTMFGSTLYLQLNKAFQSANNIVKNMDVKKGKFGDLKDYRALALNISVANALFTMAAYSGALIKGDDEDKDRAWRAVRDAALGLNLIYQIPLFGSFAEGAINKLSGERRPTSEGVNPFISVGRKIEKAFKDTSDGNVIKAVKPIVEIIVGAQFDSPIGLFNIMTGQGEEEDFYDAFGITPSYRPGYGRSGGSSRSRRRGMSKTDMKKYMPDFYEEIYGDIDEVKAEVRQMRKDIKDETSIDLE